MTTRKANDTGNQSRHGQTWDKVANKWLPVPGPIGSTDADGNDNMAEVVAAKAARAKVARRKDATTGVARQLAKWGGLEADAEAAGTVDRSMPLSALSSGWAAAINVRADNMGQQTQDKDELADELETLGVNMVRKDMLALARELTARAKALTADDVRVLTNAAGTKTTLFLAPIRPEAGINTGSYAAATVRATPGSNGMLGTTLRQSDVSPRAALKVAETATPGPAAPAKVAPAKPTKVALDW